MLLDEIGSAGDVVLLVGLQVPLNLGELALVQELVRQVLRLDLVVELAVLGGGGEVQEELADAIVDGVGAEEVKVGDAGACLLREDLA